LTSPDLALEDQLSKLEPPYKSRGEAQIGRLLDRYGIPFFHEQPLIVYDRGRHRIWHPDFTLPSYSGLIVEYAGMPDKPEYMAGIRYKQKVYGDNQISAMFVSPDDLTGPDWPKLLYESLQQERRRLYNVSLYIDL
jgi:hypothetical protein